LQRSWRECRGAHHPVSLGVTNAVRLVVHIRESSEVKWLISETLACMSRGAQSAALHPS
jgi:hypothetical protein